jgi:dienelactone hydrolase
MTRKHHQPYLNRGRNLWLIIAIVSATLWCQAAQPVIARRGPRENTDQIVQRDLVHKCVNGQALRLDLYSRSNVSGPLPVIIWIHGGGWRAGRKDNCPAVRIVDDGYAVAGIDYRITRVAPFPAQIEDCKAAGRWLRASASNYHLKPDRILVWGFSAGGAINAFMGGPIEEHRATAVAAGPLGYISNDDPPFLIILGEEDSTVPVIQCQLLVGSRKVADVETTLDNAEGRGQRAGGPKYDREIKAFVVNYLK